MPKFSNQNNNKTAAITARASSVVFENMLLTSINAPPCRRNSSSIRQNSCCTGSSSLRGENYLHLITFHTLLYFGGQSGNIIIMADLRMMKRKLMPNFLPAPLTAALGRCGTSLGVMRQSERQAGSSSNNRKKAVMFATTMLNWHERSN